MEMGKSNLGIIRKGWVFFRRGISNYNFIVSLSVLISVRNLDLFTLILGLSSVPIAILIGYIDIKYVSEKERPKVNPYTQDFLKSRILFAKSFMRFYEGEYEDAFRLMLESNRVLMNWYEGDLEDISDKVINYVED